MKIWVDSAEKLVDHPILGYGHSPYKAVTPAAQPLTDRPSVLYDDPYVHNRTLTTNNAIVGAFLATGVFGGTIYVIVLVLGLKDLYLCMKYRPEMGWLGVFYIYCLVYSFTDFRVHQAFTWFSLMALHAIAVSIKEARKGSVPK